MKVSSPKRATRTYTQHLVAPPDKVFPLLCPVREVDWIDGWDPLAVFSQSGLAERDCVFITKGSPDNAIWYITQHDLCAGLVEMLKITPSVTACKLTIQLRAVEGGSEAEISYSHTSLGPAGDALVESFTDSYYASFMKEWESRINHYLSFGSLLRDEA